MELQCQKVYTYLISTGMRRLLSKAFIIICYGVYLPRLFLLTFSTRSIIKGNTYLQMYMYICVTHKYAYIYLNFLSQLLLIIRHLSYLLAICIFFLLTVNCWVQNICIICQLIFFSILFLKTKKKKSGPKVVKQETERSLNGEHLDSECIFLCSILRQK